jgi:hypothetical protein
LLLFFDQGSEIREPGWLKIGIRDKHPGSATLVQGCDGWLFFWQIYDSPDLPESEATFAITAGGLDDAKD